VQACFVLCSSQCKELHARIPPELLSPSTGEQTHTPPAKAKAANSSVAKKAAAAAADLIAAREAEAIVDAAEGTTAVQTNGKRARKPSALKQVQSIVRMWDCSRSCSAFRSRDVMSSGVKGKVYFSLGPLASHRAFSELPGLQSGTHPRTVLHERMVHVLLIDTCSSLQKPSTDSTLLMIQFHSPVQEAHLHSCQE
jgi:hypothetical protein